MDTNMVVTDTCLNFISFDQGFKGDKESINSDQVCPFSTIFEHGPFCKRPKCSLYGGGSELRIQVGCYFKSFREVAAVLEEFCDKNFHPLKVLRSTVHDSSSADFYYEWVTYGCVHSGIYKPKGKGIRPKQSSLCMGCPVVIKFFLIRKPYRQYKITRVNLEHNHEISAELYKLYPRQRLLTPEEKEFLREAFVHVGNKDIKHIITKVFGKQATLADVRNIRQQLRIPSSKRKKDKQQEDFLLQTLVEKWKSHHQQHDLNSEKESKAIVIESALGSKKSNQCTSNSDSNKYQNYSEIIVDGIVSDFQEESLRSKVPDDKKFNQAKVYTDKLATFLSKCGEYEFRKKLEMISILTKCWENKENILLCKEENGIFKRYIGDVNCSTLRNESILKNNLNLEIPMVTEVNSNSDIHGINLADCAKSNSVVRNEINKSSEPITDKEKYTAINHLCVNTEMLSIDSQENKNEELQERSDNLPSDVQFNIENVGNEIIILSYEEEENVPSNTIFINEELPVVEYKVIQLYKTSEVCTEKSEQKTLPCSGLKNDIKSKNKSQHDVGTSFKNCSLQTINRPFLRQEMSKQPLQKINIRKPLPLFRSKKTDMKAIPLHKRLENYSLTENDIKDISSMHMLNDKIINYCQMLMNLKFPNASGLQDVLLGSVLKFKQLNSEFIQIIHCQNFPHWITMSTLGALPATVYVYDSLNEPVPRDAVLQICNIMNVQTPFLTVISKPMQIQLNNVDCGLFALASAMTLLSGKDPSQTVYDVNKMRSHLLTAVMKNDLSEFPVLNNSAVTRTLERVEVITLHCLCRQPLFKNISFQNLKKYYQCKFCKKWYHTFCKKECCDKKFS